MAISLCLSRNFSLPRIEHFRKDAKLREACDDCITVKTICNKNRHYYIFWTKDKTEVHELSRTWRRGRFFARGCPHPGEDPQELPEAVSRCN